MIHSVKCIRPRPDKLNITLDGKHHYLQNRSEGEILAIYNLARQLNISKEDEVAFSMLSAILEPTTFNYSLENLPEGLNHDDEGHLYLGGLPYVLPPDFEEVVFKYLNAGHPLEPLAKFWMRCLCNPNKEARDAFFGYCMQYGITITEEGYALLYKSVEILPKDKYPEGYVMSDKASLLEFVSESKLQATAAGKDPSRFMVFHHRDSTTLSGRYCMETNGYIV